MRTKERPLCLTLMRLRSEAILSGGEVRTVREDVSFEEFDSEKKERKEIA